MKINEDTLIDIIFDESALWDERDTTEDESDEPFLLRWSGMIPVDRKSRYMLVTDSKGKKYQYKVTLNLSKPRLVKK